MPVYMEAADPAQPKLVHIQAMAHYGFPAFAFILMDGACPLALLILKPETLFYVCESNVCDPQLLKPLIKNWHKWIKVSEPMYKLPKHTNIDKEFMSDLIGQVMAEGFSPAAEPYSSGVVNDIAYNKFLTEEERIEAKYLATYWATNLYLDPHNRHKNRKRILELYLLAKTRKKKQER